ncbi:hypothetical protein BpsS140_00041 [Bacillus phage vB_BpsS-140]|nr:hypothetical protein BpsS140_00041 [Bacillus phage vB_BpsS-140]
MFKSVLKCNGKIGDYYTKLSKECGIDRAKLIRMALALAPYNEEFRRRTSCDHQPTPEWAEEDRIIWERITEATEKPKKKQEEQENIVTAEKSENSEEGNGEHHDHHSHEHGHEHVKSETEHHDDRIYVNGTPL